MRTKTTSLLVVGRPNNQRSTQWAASHKREASSHSLCLAGSLARLLLRLHVLLLLLILLLFLLLLIIIINIIPQSCSYRRHQLVVFRAHIVCRFHANMPARFEVVVTVVEIQPVVVVIAMHPLLPFPFLSPIASPARLLARQPVCSREKERDSERERDSRTRWWQQWLWRRTCANWSVSVCPSLWKRHHKS